MDSRHLGRPDGRTTLPDRIVRVGLVALIAASAAASGILPGTLGTAAAADQTAGIGLAFSDSDSVSVEIDVSGVDDGLMPDAIMAIAGAPVGPAYGLGFQGQIDVETVQWSATTQTSVAYDDTFLRQGATVDLEDSMTPGPGTATFSGDFNGYFGIFQDADNDPVPPYDWQPYLSFDPISKAWSKSVSCEMRLTGDGSGECTITALDLPLADLPLLPGLIHVLGHVVVELTIAVDPAGVVTVREASIAGTNMTDTTDVAFDGPAPAVAQDSVDLPCGAPVGNQVEYGFAGATYDPATDLETHTILAATTYNPILGPDLGSFGTTNLFEGIKHQDLDLALTSAGGSTDLGEIKANNIPPVADPGPSVYSGTQGQASTFSGIGSESVCGVPTLRWDFSDGGVAYGPLPKHTFQGSGWYTGLLTATDSTGLTDTATFAIDVANAAPAANAGPDTTAKWGRPVAFNGSAADGADDQGTLAYSWSFGDGIVATGGASAIHAYSAPGVYNAQFTATDKHGASGSDVRSVTVLKRDVTAAFLGSNGTFDTAGTLSASLVDEFGSPVTGRLVEFSVDGLEIGHALTNGSGIATLGYTPFVDAANHSVNVAFAEDARYTGASSNGVIAVAKKATSVAYTGAVKGSPNKAASLSATLKDATGKALVGRIVAFKVGSQTTEAITDANGVAATTLVITQKPGIYPLSASWTPTGTDASRYTGSTASGTYSLQRK
jgi:PKD repeat protein